MEEITNTTIFKLIFDHAPFGIYTLNKEGIIDSFNPKMVEMAGSKDPSEVVGLNVFSMSSYESAGLNILFRRGLEGKAFETEVKYSSQTGNKESWRHYRGVPLLSEQRFVTGLLLIVEDVTERNTLQDKLNKYTTQLEDEIKKRTGDLVSLEKQYEVMVEKSLVGTSILQDGLIRYVNPMYVSIFGYEKKEELIGKSWKEMIAKEDIEIVEKTGLEARMRGQGEPAIYTVRGIKKDGTIIDLEISSSPTFFNGKPAAVSSLRDVTAKIAEEKKEEKHLQEVERMNRLMIDRELRMSELKKRNKELEDLLAEKTSSS